MMPLSTAKVGEKQ